MKLTPFLLAACFLAGFSLRAAPLRDHGIDPANLGKGDWLSYLEHATNHFRDAGSPPDILPVMSVVDVPTLMAYEKKLGMDYVIVKAGTGAEPFLLGNRRQFNREVVAQAHAAGLKIFGYTRSYGKDVPGEIKIAEHVFACGADGFVIDAEAEWEPSRQWIGTNGPALALQLCQGLRERFPNKFLGHSPMPIISYHRTFPYREFGLYCDAVMPQLYWTSFDKTPEATVAWMDREWRAWHASLKGADTNAIKPIVPVGPGGPGLAASEVVDFMNCLKSDPAGVTDTGYRGVNFFRGGRYPFDVQRVLAGITYDDIVSNRTEFLRVSVDNVTLTDAVVHWSTRTPTRGAVAFGTTTNYGAAQAEAAGKPVFNHQLVLTNLQANTLYHFRLTATNAAQGVLTSGDFLLLTPRSLPVADIVLDNVQATKTGTWTAGKASLDREGPNYLYSQTTNANGQVEFTTTIATAGIYEISERHPAGSNRTTNALHIISCGKRQQTNAVNQRAVGGDWRRLAVWPMAAGAHFSVKILGQSPDNQAVIADAIRLRYVEPKPTAKEVRALAER